MKLKFTNNSDSHQVHKVIITGTGRAGTTFLVQLLTALGLETGFKDIQEGVYESCNAGMERDLIDSSAPYIVKNPSLCDDLAQILQTGEYAIDHAFIPIRSLEAATRSRIQVFNQARPNGGYLRLLLKGSKYKAVPGGLIDTDNPDEQQTILAQKLYNLIYTLTIHDIPHTFLHFPRIIKDAQYLYSKLAPIMDGIDYSGFLEFFNDVAKPELVHDFSKPGLKRLQSSKIDIQNSQKGNGYCRWQSTVGLRGL
ncbi:MAG: hypothetical protein HY881_05990 [Deltaproteobacteria bacterium]|nr:hypothetical protein [Deltaproteobacteria bacterium]